MQFEVSDPGFSKLGESQRVGMVQPINWPKLHENEKKMFRVGGGAHVLSSCKSANGLSNIGLLITIKSKKYIN